MMVARIEDSLERLYQYRETADSKHRNSYVADAFAEAVHRCAQEVSDLGLRHLRVYCLPPDEGQEADHIQRAIRVRARLREMGHTVTPIQARETDLGERFFVVVGTGGQQAVMQEQAERIARRIFAKATDLIDQTVDAYSFSSIAMPGVRHTELQADPLLAYVYNQDQVWSADLEIHRTRMEPDYTPLRREIERRLQELGKESPYFWRIDQEEHRYELLKVDDRLSLRKRRELVSKGWRSKS